MVRTRLLQALRLRFNEEPSADLLAAVAGQADAAVLDRWFDVALTAASLTNVRAAFGLP
jgi:hypothetical protein